jgi:hypothetical protein
MIQNVGLVAKVLPEAHFNGRRIYVEIKPTDNPDIVVMELDRIITSVVMDKLTERQRKQPEIIKLQELL